MSKVNIEKYRSELNKFGEEYIGYNAHKIKACIDDAIRFVDNPDLQEDAKETILKHIITEVIANKYFGYDDTCCCIKHAIQTFISYSDFNKKSSLSNYLKDALEEFMDFKDNHFQHYMNFKDAVLKGF